MREVVRVRVESVENTELRDEEEERGGLIRPVNGTEGAEVEDGLLGTVRFPGPLGKFVGVLLPLFVRFGIGSLGSSFSVITLDGAGGTLSTTKHLVNLLFPCSTITICSSIDPWRCDPILSPPAPCPDSRASPANVGALGRVVRTR